MKRREFTKITGAGRLAMQMPSMISASLAAGTDKKTYEIESQKSELLRSLDYLRKECGAGIQRS